MSLENPTDLGLALCLIRRSLGFLDSAAKFAVKGLSEALITDFRLNAPHIGVSVVMPGHISTKIAVNVEKIAGFTYPSEFADNFEKTAPLSAAGAATIILDSVKAGKWRILVGEDAKAMDEAVRADPENAYTMEFYEKLHARNLQP